MQKDLSNHKHSTDCGVDECYYLTGRVSRRECSCGGIRHCVDSNWDDYDFGSGRGYVQLTLMCDTCKEITKTEG